MTDVDLTPRERAPRKKRAIGPLLLVLVIVVAIGALLFKTLGDASLFFKNADEAVEQRDDLGAQRFRMLGSVVPGTINKGQVDGRKAVLFTVSFNGVFADVASFDNPTELFKDGIPVVLEGRWRAASTVTIDALDCAGATAAAFTGGAKDGWYFESDRILVKHDANYSSANKDRLDEAAADGTVTGASGAVSKSCTATAGTAK
jgi:cytochrome c-type biogenesis protein CcmE